MKKTLIIIGISLGSLCAIAVVLGIVAFFSISTLGGRSADNAAPRANIGIDYAEKSLKESGDIMYDLDSLAMPGFIHNDPSANPQNPDGRTPPRDEMASKIVENKFLRALSNPLSTFSIDVDTASYTLLRSNINNGARTESTQIRIEEMINYFNYDYAQPKDGNPFSINTEYAPCPWNKDHKIALIGLQGLKIDITEAPSSNLVFLIDVSGSMSDANKLPLLKKSFELLLPELRDQDRIAMVVYAGASGLVLDSTPGNMKREILEALEELSAGGSTAGAEGINLAYQIASENFIEGGNNRVILATDGDFNVGASSDEELVKLIEKKREQGVFLSVLGFGRGNYKDTKMEQLADNGNGNYAYIDTLKEAQKVFVNEFGGTMFTIAKDVKIQVEFNPALVSSYRLIGYENRMLATEDFEDDTKDAGELGSGHTVTALYEIIPAKERTDQTVDDSDKGKYVRTTIKDVAYTSNEVMTIKFRYKKPDENESRLLEHILKLPKGDEKLSDNIVFASAVAEFGLYLRLSAYRGTANIKQVLERARSASGHDALGYRAEFIELVEKYRKMQEAK